MEKIYHQIMLSNVSKGSFNELLCSDWKGARRLGRKMLTEFRKHCGHKNQLDQFLWRYVYHKKLEDHQPKVMFQQDGAPSKWTRTVWEFLVMHFPGGWVGRDGPISWPTRSPDITTSDFYLWALVRTIFTIPTGPLSMNWNSELILRSKQLHRKHWRTLWGKLKTAWAFYVPWKAGMLKLFSILQYWFYSY